MKLTRIVFGAVPAALLAVFAIVAPAGAASAATGGATEVNQQLHLTQPFNNVNPCTGDILLGTETSNIQSHETIQPDGTATKGTMHEVDNFSATDPATGVTFNGTASAWDGFNLNRQAQEEGFTFNITATGSDGSTVTYHENAQITMNADGTITVNRDTPSLTCG